MNPAVSIVTPAYNPGEFLRLAAQSVMSQSLSDWEWIVVDDGSSQDLTWVREIDPRVRLIQQANAGVSAARNRGIQESRGRYVAFLDADDVWRPTKLQTQAALLDGRLDVGLCHTAFECIDAGGRVTGAGFSRHVESYADLLRGSAVLTSTVMVRRECLNKVGPFDVQLHGPEDYDLFLRVAREFKTAFLPEPLVLYRSTGTGLSRNHARMFAQSCMVVRRHRGWARRHGDAAAVEAATFCLRRLKVSYACARFDLARAAFRRRAWGEFAAGMAAAIRHHPAYVAGSLAASACHRRARAAVPVVDKSGL